jgi:hypothetical protein
LAPPPAPNQKYGSFYARDQPTHKCAAEAGESHGAKPSWGASDELTEIELRAIHYRRSPSHATTWAKVSAAEFPWFGMAEVMLAKSDDELAGFWRECFGDALKMTAAFQQICARWLDGAEAMAAMVRRMERTQNGVEAESADEHGPRPGIPSGTDGATPTTPARA